MGGQPGSGRPRKPSPTEIERELIEEHVAVILRPHWRVLGYDLETTGEGRLKLVAIEGGGAKLYGESKDGYIQVSEHDDLGAMVNAAEKMRDRVYGRPRQATELSGPGGGPIQTETAIPTDKDFERRFAGALEEAGLAGSSTNGSNGAGSNGSG